MRETCDLQGSAGRSTVAPTASKRRYWFSTRDLVTIAILATLGGVLSTYIGYIGKMMSPLLGVSLGAGQVMAGLHVVWLVIVYGLVRRPGSATVAGLLKGIVELFAGSTHGVVVIVVSCLQGVIFDGVMVGGTTIKNATPSRVRAYIGAGLASVSSVAVFYFLYLNVLPLPYLLFISAISFVSGIIFGGYFGLSLVDYTTRAGFALSTRQPSVPRAARLRDSKVRAYVQMVTVIAFVALFVGGAVSYHMQVATSPSASLGFKVTGAIEQPFYFTFDDYTEQQVSITTEFTAKYKYSPPEDYTGVPLKIIIEDAHPSTEATMAELEGVDGYTAALSLDEILASDTLIIVEKDGTLQLIAGGYDGTYWVRDIVEVRIY